MYLPATVLGALRPNILLEQYGIKTVDGSSGFNIDFVFTNHRKDKNSNDTRIKTREAIVSFSFTLVDRYKA
jgi:hypothetical protein